MHNNNRLLRALPPEEAGRVLEHLEPCYLEVPQTLCEPNRAVEAVYFPISCVASMVSDDEAAGTLELATIGNEGMTGLSLFLGVDNGPMRVFIQVAGDALRMEADAFTRLVDELPGLRRMLRRFTQASFVQVAQNAVCLASHDVEHRCARWLLMTHDRVDGERFELTHEFLAFMLGVRRAGVSEAMAKLHSRGLIEYERGVVTVRDRPGLDAASCACYGLIRREYDRLLH